MRFLIFYRKGAIQIINIIIIIIIIIIPWYNTRKRWITKYFLLSLVLTTKTVLLAEDTRTKLMLPWDTTEMSLG